MILPRYLVPGVQTEAERDLLALVLREIRHVAATGEQLSILVDPFAAGDGANVCFSYNGDGWSTALKGRLTRRRKRSRRAVWIP